MEELGESDVAGRMESLINSDTIDELLKAFSDFAEEHHRDNRVPVHLALKAAQVVMKLERAFRKDELSHIIDPTLVQRAGRLLSDYTTMMRGFSPPGELSGCDIIALVEALVTGLSVSSCSMRKFSTQLMMTQLSCRSSWHGSGHARCLRTLRSRWNRCRARSWPP